MKTYIHLVAVLFVACALVSGCSHEEHSEADHGHDHSGDRKIDSGHRHDIGPEGQPLEVLGNHQFHAEVLAEPTSGKVAVKVYTTDNKPAAVTAKEMQMSAVIQGESRIYNLTLAPTEDKEQPAAFQIQDADLAKRIAGKTWENEIQLSLIHNGVPCNGNLAKPETGDHDHDHHDHRHSH